MTQKQRPILLLGSIPLFMPGGVDLEHKVMLLKDRSGAMVMNTGLNFSLATIVQDQGPEGIFVDVQGHDDNDDVVGNVTYNNQSSANIRIESIYVHGENITTQGRFVVHVDISPGTKKQIFVILRDKKGKPAKASVDVHYE